MFKNIKLKDNTKKLNKIDWIIMGIMVLIYGILSFIRLGDTKVPNTYYNFHDIGDSISINLNEVKDISKIRYYTGNALGEIGIYSSLNGIDYELVTTIKIDSVLSWQDMALGTKASFIKFVATQANSTLGDIALYDEYNKIIPLTLENNNPLNDEAYLVPQSINYMNSTYFDEI